MSRFPSSCPTVRKFPRTLNEAFGCDGYAITVYPPKGNFLWDCLFAIALGLLGAWLLFWWLSK